MNFGNRNRFDIVVKFKKFRAIYDKIYITIAGFLWIFSTLWDIYKLQRYWLDYTIEFYTSFFLFLMMIYSINPKSLPKRMYTSFRLITTIRGRGLLLIIISSLFLNDKHSFHKFCAIILLIGGIFYFICEILVPTTSEELDKIEEMYIFNNNNKNKNTTEVKIVNKNINEEISNRMEELKGISNNQINITVTNNDNGNDINNNNSINVNVTESNLIDDNNNNNLEQINEINQENNNANNDDNNNSNVYENEIVRKTDNPYEIPDDF